jgi:hypothetical protein
MAMGPMIESISIGERDQLFTFERGNQTSIYRVIDLAHRRIASRQIASLLQCELLKTISWKSTT